MERVVKSVLYASRWILAPIYIGLIGALFAILLKSYVELYHLVLSVAHAKESQLVLKVLGLIDLTLIGGLLLMVMLSGFENFISNSEQSGEEKLGWLGKLDANSLKLKVAASIVAISSIHLLQIFMDVTSYSTSQAIVYIALHLTFVLSACLMGLLNKVVTK